MIFHFLVDALCGSTMLGCVVKDLPEKAFELVMLYNALAFATQVFTGWLADKLKRDRWLCLASIVILVSGATGALKLPWLATVLLGLGNSLFHVSAGREVIRHYAHREMGRACELGLFVAPGALGIGLGCMFPMELYMISLGGFFLALSPFLWIWPLETPETEAVEKSESIDVQSLLAAAVMTFCVFCRAASGFCTEAPWKASTALTILCFVLVMGGKMTGGFVGAVRVRRQKCRRRTVRSIHRQLDDGHYFIYIGPFVSVVARTDVRSCGGRPVSWQFDADAAEPRIYFQCRLSAGGHKLRHRMVAVP